MDDILDIEKISCTFRYIYIFFSITCVHQSLKSRGRSALPAGTILRTPSSSGNVVQHG